MAVPASSTAAGPLDLLETYVFYEGPRFFCAQAGTGQRYLGVFVEEDERSETHLYLPVSAERFVAVRSGLMPIRDALLQAQAPIFVVMTTYSDSTSFENWWTVHPDELQDSWLPAPDAVLRLPTPTRSGFDAAALGFRSTAEGRALLGVRLPDKSLRTEYGARDVVAVIGRLQDATSSLGQELRGSPTAAGMLPVDVLEQTELAIVDLQAASFAIILAPISPPTWQLQLEPPLARRSLVYLLDLAEAAQDQEKLRSLVSSLHRRAKTKLRDFLETVVDLGAPLILELASPSSASRSVEVSVGSARRGLTVLADTSEDSELLAPFNAHLIGVNLRTRSYEVNRMEDGMKFAGRMEPEAGDMIRGKPTGEGRFYQVLIRKDIVVDAITGEERPKHRLLSIADAAPSPAV